MPISFVASGTVATGSNPVMAVPAGVQQNDIMFLVIALGSGAAFPSTPSGWTSVVGTTNDPKLVIFRKFASTVENSFTLTAASTTRAVILAYRGVSQTDTVTAAVLASSTTTVSTNTLTTTYANEYVISAYSMINTGSDATWTAPGSTTQRVNSGSSASSAGLLIVDELRTAAGISSSRTATSSASKTLNAYAISIIPSGRYWVGGTNNWDGTAGTKWSFSSGGSGGAPLPALADDVYFDAASGAITCTIASGNTGAKSIDCTGFTGTLTGTAAITVAGSITLAAGMTFTHTGTTTITGNSTITSAGKTIGALTVDALSSTVTLGDALNIGTSRTLTITQGTFTTQGYNVTAMQLFSSNSNARTINLGSSTINLNLTSNALDFTTSTNLTLNAGTSQINLTAASASVIFSGGGRTFYNVSFASGTTTKTIQGQNTFSNLTVAGPSAVGVTQVTFDSTQTINGTLSTTGTAGNRRVWFRGLTEGLVQILNINSAPSLVDVDFRDIYVVGTAAPISGTRIGDLRGNRGITFNAKTVYWNLPAGGNWSATAWAASSGGAVSADNFPLAQDTAVIENTGLNTSATVTLDSALPYFGTIDMFTRTNAMTLAGSTAYTVYGDWKFGSGVARSYSGTLTFSGRNIQTITSAGKLFGQQIAIDTYGGTVEPADALNLGTIGSIAVTNGKFDTKNYNITCTTIFSNNSNVREIYLGSSTITTNSTPVTFTTSTNLTFNAGTSQINCSVNGDTFSGGGQTFYNLTYTSNSTAAIFTFSGTNTFNNISFTAPISAGFVQCVFAANQTINGTLTVAGASPVRRLFVRSDTLGTPRTLTVGTLAATDCDFRNIVITGTAAGSTPTRAGNCGGNSGITFPTAKTVYWNLAGTQNWSATGWADASGGTPAINNFPLAQDIAVFDNAGTAGTVTIDQAWAIGTFDASARTSAMTFSVGTPASLVFGDWKWGTGVTSSTTTGSIICSNPVGTQTITSSAVQFNFAVQMNSISGKVQLADALLSSNSLNIQSGEFDAVLYNVTVSRVSIATSSTIFKTLRMGSGTWTLSATNPWDPSGDTSTLKFYKGTANIVLSNNSTTARDFNGAGLSYNKLTIGGTTSTSTTTIAGNNTFTELASTKTVAHTINFGVTTQVFGKWTVSGTLGNVVTVNGGGTSHVIAGARVSEIDYVNMYIGFSTGSPGEFYAGANSVGTGTRVINTAAPAPTTRYWVGGTGNWDNATTTRWSATSGGLGGASVPTSADDVIFDAASSAGSYTVTIVATIGARCNSLTFAAPASGTVTWAGTAALYIHGNVTLPATGLTRTYSGAITLSGSTAGKTFTTNGVVLASNIFVDGIGCDWSLGSALSISTLQITLTNGGLDFNNYNLIAGAVAVNINTPSNSIKIILGSSVLTLSSSSSLYLNTTEQARANLTFNAGTSQINCSSNGSTFNGNNQTFYNVSFTNTSVGVITLNGANTFNNLSFSGINSIALNQITFAANQTVNGTLTFSAGTNATMRHFVRSDAIGATRTLTCAAFSGTDADFRDITIAGAAAPASGTRLGDRKGNSGITFPVSKNVYCVATTSANFTSNIWSDVPNGTADLIYYPLPQDDVIFTATRPSASSTISTTTYGQYVRTIDTSARIGVEFALTINMAANGFTFFGDFIQGSGVTISFTSALVTAAGRTLQNITSSGRPFPSINVDSIGGTVRLLDAFQATNNNQTAVNVERGTFDANGYNVTLASTSNGRVYTAYTTARSINIGSGTWTLARGNGQDAWDASTATNLTVTGTGTISLTHANAKTFIGGGVSYAGITLNQGGAGTLTITGNNTFANISNTYRGTGATTIALGTTTQRVGTFSASGAPGAILTITGASATSPATLIYTGSGEATPTKPNHLTIIGVRAYNLADTWYAGANSTNQGSLGWIFAASSAVALAASTFFLMF